MGYMRHHAIVVTDHGYGNILDGAHLAAKKLFKWVSPISDHGVNGIRSFFVPPDGSKEGWTESDEGDVARDKFIAFLEATRDEDGGGPMDWAEVQFGDDEGDDKILRHS